MIGHLLQHALRVFQTRLQAVRQRLRPPAAQQELTEAERRLVARMLVDIDRLAATPAQADAERRAARALDPRRYGP